MNQKTASYRIILLLITLLVGLFPISGGAQEKKDKSTSSTAASPSAYTLNPEDLLDITVYQEDDLASKVRVGKDGIITFPLVGGLKVGGLSPEAAAQTIRTALAKDYLVNPQVTVTVLEYAKRRFTVLGQVQKPGAYEMPDNDQVNLLQAIGIAGGFTRIADPSRLTLKRVSNGQEVLYKLNAKNMAGEKATSDFTILPGDIISVGESVF